MSECAAAFPIKMTKDANHGWIICGKPATANHTYLCRCGRHLINRSSCAEHAPTPGLPVGCRRCWDEGHFCMMVVQN